jgi:hypothetical protein
MCEKSGLLHKKLTNLLVLFLAVVLREHLQLDLEGQTGADLQMMCTLHPSQLSLALLSLSFQVLHVAGN